jgi:hypothetical protein
MRITLFATVAALGLAMAVPAFADIGKAPDMLASAGTRAVTNQTANGGGAIGTNSWSNSSHQQAAGEGAREGTPQQQASGEGAREGAPQQLASGEGAREGAPQQLASGEGAREGAPQQAA